MKDKRLYPNTVIFQTTDGKGVTYYNARLLEQIRDEITRFDANGKSDPYRTGVSDMQDYVLKLIGKYR